MENRMKVTLLPHTPFLRMNGTFDKEKAMHYSAQIAGECYEPLGWEKLSKEEESKTIRRQNNTLGNEHQTPYEHISIGMEIVNIPKILAMILNNERQCSTSEKSARYTAINGKEDPSITIKEEQLYEKWMTIFKAKIKSQYGQQFNDSKIEKLAQENSRYLVTVFASTKMIHTVPMIQLNRIVCYMKDLIAKENKTMFETRLVPYLSEFIDCLDQMNVLDNQQQSNRKERKLSLFGEKEVPDSFDYTYSTNYKGSFAQLAQAQRHRTLEYEMLLMEDASYFVPPILQDEPTLVAEWLRDINSVGNVFPQGQLVSINEKGSYEKFILKTKERLCSAAQLEIMLQTKQTLTKYAQALQEQNHPLKDQIIAYTHGARCTFPDYTCISDCKFCEGKALTRKTG